MEYYDQFLEDTECEVCGHVGMEPDGSYEYCCPECGETGSMYNEEEDYEDDYDDEEEDYDDVDDDYEAGDAYNIDDELETECSECSGTCIVFNTDEQEFTCVDCGHTWIP